MQKVLIHSLQRWISMKSRDLQINFTAPKQTSVDKSMSLDPPTRDFTQLNHFFLHYRGIFQCLSSIYPLFVVDLYFWTLDSPELVKYVIEQSKPGSCRWGSGHQAFICQHTWHIEERIGSSMTGDWIEWWTLLLPWISNLVDVNLLIVGILRRSEGRDFMMIEFVEDENSGIWWASSVHACSSNTVHLIAVRSRFL